MSRNFEGLREPGEGHSSSTMTDSERFCGCMLGDEQKPGTQERKVSSPTCWPRGCGSRAISGKAQEKQPVSLRQPDAFKALRGLL